MRRLIAPSTPFAVLIGLVASIDEDFDMTHQITNYG
jgi:hypothetical protein